jgi:hypothetical protein
MWLCGSWTCASLVAIELSKGGKKTEQDYVRGSLVHRITAVFWSGGNT